MTAALSNADVPRAAFVALSLQSPRSASYKVKISRQPGIEQRPEWSDSFRRKFVAMGQFRKLRSWLLNGAQMAAYPMRRKFKMAVSEGRSPACKTQGRCCSHGRHCGQASVPSLSVEGAMRQARATDRRAAAPISTAGAVPMNGNAAPWSDRKATGRCYTPRPV